MAIKLILHAIRMVFSNFSDALKIALIPYLLGQFAILAVFSLYLVISGKVQLRLIS